MLSFLILLTSLSVLGRGLNTFLNGVGQSLFPEFANWFLSLGVGPINGDFEVVEAGVAFAIFAFIPLCQLKAGHAEVGLFTSRLRGRAVRALTLFIDLIFATALVLITVQLLAGTQSKYEYGETTFLIQFPVWWSYAASFCAAVTASVVGIYVALVRIVEFRTNTAILNAE